MPTGLSIRVTTTHSTRLGGRSGFARSNDSAHSPCVHGIDIVGFARQQFEQLETRVRAQRSRRPVKLMMRNACVHEWRLTQGSARQLMSIDRRSLLAAGATLSVTAA